MTETDPSYVLLPPHSTCSLENTLFSKVCAALATRYDVSVSTVQPRLHKAEISMWGKIRCLDGGDTMHASALMSTGEDCRDASHVRVSRSPSWAIPLLTIPVRATS